MAVNVPTPRAVATTLTNPTLAEYTDAVAADPKAQPPVCQCSVTSAQFGDIATLAVTRHPICGAVGGFIAGGGSDGALLCERDAVARDGERGPLDGCDDVRPRA